ncbi:hypothetical protein D3C78_1402640 [compost metagenome]
MGAGGDDLVVQRIDQVGDFRSGAGGDLLDGGDAVLLVARVDPLGTVAGEEVDIEAQAGYLFEHRHADFLGGAGVDGGLVDDDIALLEHLADGLRGLDQRGEVGLLVLVDRRRHGDDERVAGGQVVEAGAIGQPGGFLQLIVADFQGGIVASPERVDA